MALPQWDWVNRVETHWLSGKRKFQVQQSVKKVRLIVFWDMKELITIDFFEKVLL